jgi:hypothetical protein
MFRRPNRKQSREPITLTLSFMPQEFSILKWNTPGPSGVMGGYQGFENLLINQTDRDTLRCELNNAREARLRQYILNYGPGGPNSRIREACIPALRRIGIDLLPDWRARELALDERW